MTFHETIKFHIRYQWKRNRNAIIHFSSKWKYSSGLNCSATRKEVGGALLVAKRHKVGNTRCTPGVHRGAARRGAAYKREVRRHGDRYIYIYILYVYMYFWTPTRFGVGEMAWTNEATAATRQVLSILSTPAVVNPRQNQSGCRVYITHSRYFASRNKSIPAPVSPAPLIHPGTILSWAREIRWCYLSSDSRYVVSRRSVLRRLGDIMNAPPQNSFPFLSLFFSFIFPRCYRIYIITGAKLSLRRGLWRVDFARLIYSPAQKIKKTDCLR